MQEFEHQLQLSDLDTHHTLSKKISYIHDIVCQNYPHIDRLAIAKYDRHDDILRTYVGSRKGNNPLTLYEAKLSEVPSLLKLARNRETRIINDLRVFPDSKSTHSRRVLDRGFRSSYTIPLYNDGQFIGMLFLIPINAMHLMNLT